MRLPPFIAKPLSSANRVKVIALTSTKHSQTGQKKVAKESNIVTKIKIVFFVIILIGSYQKG